MGKPVADTFEVAEHFALHAVSVTVCAAARLLSDFLFLFLLGLCLFFAGGGWFLSDQSDRVAINRDSRHVLLLHIFRHHRLCHLASQDVRRKWLVLSSCRPLKLLLLPPFVGNDCHGRSLLLLTLASCRREVRSTHADLVVKLGLIFLRRDGLVILLRCIRWRPDVSKRPLLGKNMVTLGGLRHELFHLRTETDRLNGFFGVSVVAADTLLALSKLVDGFSLGRLHTIKRTSKHVTLMPRVKNLLLVTDDDPTLETDPGGGVTHCLQR